MMGRIAMDRRTDWLQESQATHIFKDLRGGRFFVRGSRLFLGSGAVVEDGVIEVVGNKIERTGVASDFSATALEEYTFLFAAFLMPGLIDAHTHLGVWRQGVGDVGHDLNETSDVMTPHVRAIDSLDPRDSAFVQARRSGVTAVVIAPGSGTLIAGQICVVKTCGDKLSDMLVKSPVGLKVSFGAVPLWKYGGKGPATRMGAIAMLREAFVASQNYMAVRSLKGKAYTRNLRLEALAMVLQRQMPLHVHVHEAHNIATVLRLAEEFDVEVVLIHATEGALLADDIANAKIPVVFGPALMSQQTPELQALSFETAATLCRAGVAVATTTDHGAVPIDRLALCAALTYRSGMPYTAALESVSSIPSQICGLSDRIGTLEPGRDADIVAFNGDPFDTQPDVEATFIDGRPVYMRDRSGGVT